MASATAQVSSCKCSNEGQDSIYGKNNRVFNQTSKKASDKTISARCTVCGIEKQIVVS